MTCPLPCVIVDDVCRHGGTVGTGTTGARGQPPLRRAMGRPPEAATLRERTGQRLLAIGDAGGARLLHDAADVYRRFGLEAEAERCERVADAWLDLDRHAGVEPWDQLTSREREVVELVADGLANAQVAEVLQLSRHTVETHLKRVYAKLGVTSRVALTRAYLLRHPPRPAATA